MELMNSIGGKIRSFTDLHAWKEGHTLVIELYRCTKSFPSEEQFGLINQLRRAAVSITSNIAEGFSRKSRKEKQQFYRTALGSLVEIQNQLLISRDVQYLPANAFSSLTTRTVTLHKILNGLLRTASDHP